MHATVATGALPTGNVSPAMTAQDKKDLEITTPVWVSYWTIFFQVCLFSVCLLLVSYYKVINAFLIDTGGYTRVSAFHYAPKFLALIVVCRVFLVNYVYKPLGRVWLASVKYKYTDEEDWVARVDRFSICAFKFTYFVTIVSWGYVLLKDTHFFPSELGGKGDFHTAMAHFPVDPNSFDFSEGIIAYYMCQLAYHFHSLLFQFSMHARNDLLEMLLHHSCTVFLLGFSYACNFTKIGLVIVFLHDVGDIFSYLVKCFADSAHKKTTFVIFLGVLASWGYTRLFLFPQIIYYLLFLPQYHPECKADQLYLVNFFSFQLSLLQILHFYWYSLFLFMGYRFLTTGSTKDVQNQIVSKKIQGKTKAQ